ncbi:MAG: hypothetical protein LBJ39_05260 [Tannerellaceae bacterium]|jgi:hypothetical protein|nr:hypothetical protein [Tannerellaceae bacterium]
MSRISNYILCVLLLFFGLSTGCVQEEKPVPAPPKPSEQEKITLYFRDASRAATRALNDSLESVVKNIDVLIFKSEYNQLKLTKRIEVSEGDIRSVADDYTKKEFTITVERNYDYYQYVILANARNEVVKYINSNPIASQLKDDVMQNIISENTSLWNTDPGASGFRFIPMCGESDGVRTIAQLDKTEIKLFRSLVRVDVKIDEGVPFDLEKAYVYNRPSRGRVAPDPAAWNDSQKRFVAPSLPADMGIVDTENNNANFYTVKGNRSVHEIYLYETDGQATKDFVKATCLVLGGKYNNKTNYYRVDFAELSEQSSGSSNPPSGNWWEQGPPASDSGNGGMVGTGDIYHPLIRNHHYEISITGVRGDGSDSPDKAVRTINTQLSAEFLTWDNKNQDIIIDNTPYTLEVKPSEVTISQSTSGEITFNTNYPNAKWKLGEPTADWIECKIAGSKITVSYKTSVAVPPSGSEGYFRLNLIDGTTDKHKISQQIKVVYK